MVTKKYLKIILLFCSLYFQNFHAVTLLYSMRIRRIFDISEALSNGRKSNLIVSAVPIYYQRNTSVVDDTLGINTCESRKVGGSIFNFRYASASSWWFEATTAIATEHLRATGMPTLSASRSGLDDIVISAGYNMFPAKDMQLVPYIIAGFPTHWDVTTAEIQGTLLGTRFYSAGAGLEFSYGFINTLPRALNLIIQLRFLHLFDRHFFPILPCEGTIHPGNVTDALFTIQYREKKGIFEIGYNPTFFTNQAIHLPTETIEGENFVRHSVYFDYAHAFPTSFLCQKPLILGAGCNVGWSKRLDTKIFSCWLNITVVF